MINVAFTGKKHSGKTTAANILRQDERWGPWGTVSLAFEVKKEAAHMLNLSLDNLGIYDQVITLRDIEQHKDTVFRPFLQWLGTDFYRRFIGKENIWAELMLNSVAQYMAQGRPVICDGIRFPNEAEQFRHTGGMVIRLHRDTGDDEDTHESETSVDDIRPDAVISNNGTVEDLQSSLSQLMDFYQLWLFKTGQHRRPEPHPEGAPWTAQSWHDGFILITNAENVAPDFKVIVHRADYPMICEKYVSLEEQGLGPVIVEYLEHYDPAYPIPEWVHVGA